MTPKEPLHYETYKDNSSLGTLTRVLAKFKLRLKKRKKLTKVERSTLQNQRKRAILGIGLLLVVVSITFSTYVTLTFVDGIAVYAALAPQVAFATLSLLKAFSKLYK